jgi:hypothetical protein
MTTWTVVSTASSTWIRALGYVLVNYVADDYVAGDEQSSSWTAAATADNTWTEA